MRQGRASYQGQYGHKVEPKAHAVNPGAVSHIGTMLGDHTTDGRTIQGAGRPLYEGRGLEAPKAANRTCNSGSQGKY